MAALCLPRAEVIPPNTVELVETHLVQLRRALNEALRAKTLGTMEEIAVGHVAHLVREAIIGARLARRCADPLAEHLLAVQVQDRLRWGRKIANLIRQSGADSTDVERILSALTEAAATLRMLEVTTSEG
jgi:hypothetical protein